MSYARHRVPRTRSSMPRSRRWASSRARTRQWCTGGATDATSY
jgi:hypothetical protein